MTLDQSFFLSRAQQLFPSYFSGLSPAGLAGHQGQAKIMEFVATLAATYQQRGYIGQATGIWLDLHALSLGLQRQSGETDTQLQSRCVQLSDNITPNALKRLVAAVTPAGTKVETLDQFALCFWEDTNSCAGYDPAYVRNFDTAIGDVKGDADGIQTGGGTVNRVARPASLSPSQGFAGMGLDVESAGVTIGIQTRAALPSGVQYQLSAIVNEAAPAGGNASVAYALGGTSGAVDPNTAQLSQVIASDGTGPASVKVTTSAAGIFVDELAIVCLQPQLVVGGLIPSDGGGGVVLHIGAPSMEYPLAGVAGAAKATVDDGDFSFSWRDDLGPAASMQALGTYLAILAAVLAGKAAGIQVSIWLDPFYQ